MKELVDKIAAQLKIVPNPDRLRVFKRKRGITYQETNFESIYYEEILDKALKDIGIYDGSYIYAETIDSDEGFKRSQWIKALEEDKARIHVLFNNPYESTSTDYSAAYQSELVVNKNILLIELKKLLGARLNISVDEFVFRRTGKEGPELKEMGSTLGSLGFIRNSIVYIEFGKPSLPDEFKLSLSEAVMSTSDNDAESHEFLELGDFFIMSSSTVFQVKSIISEKLKQERCWIVPPSRIRLRERCSDKLGKVFFDSQEMKFYGIYDGKPVAFQILDQDEMLGPDDIVIMIREWDTTNWNLSDRKEIVIKSTWRMHDLAYCLCDHFPQYRNQIDQLLVSKVPSIWDFKRGSLTAKNVTIYTAQHNSGRNCTKV